MLFVDVITSSFILMEIYLIINILSGLMCILWQGTVTVEELTLRWAFELFLFYFVVIVLVLKFPFLISMVPFCLKT